MGKDVGAIHNYLCDKIREKKENTLSNSELVISREDFRRMLGWYNIPFYIQCKVIKEMKEMGLIKIKDKQNIILVSKGKDNSWFD